MNLQKEIIGFIVGMVFTGLIGAAIISTNNINSRLNRIEFFLNQATKQPAPVVHQEPMVHQESTVAK